MSDLVPSIRYGLLVFVILLSACNTVKDVKTGEEAFDKKQYNRAISMLTNEYAQSPQAVSKARKAYLIGKCYEINSEFDAAVDWYESSLNHEENMQTLLSLANSYKSTEQYDKAINAYTVLFQKSTDKDRFQKEINICKEVKSWKESDNPFDFELKSFGANTSFSEYGVSIDRSGLINFVSDRPSEINADEYNWTGRGYSDVYRASDKGTFLELFDEPINSVSNEGPVCFSQDYNEIYFTRCAADELRDDYCRIYYSYNDRGEWTEPVPLKFFSESVNYGNPALIDQDSVIIFSAMTNGTDHDLYYAVKEPNGWSSAIPMPDYINSIGNDGFPTVDKDTLYFSSDGHPGLGGLDIFKCHLNDVRKFTTPENLRKPINSAADDFHYVIAERDAQSYEGYFSTSRGFVGSDDVVFFSATQREKTEEEVVAEEGENLNETTEKLIYLAVTIKGQTEEGQVVKLSTADLNIRQNNSEIDVDERAGIYIMEVDSLDQIFMKATADDYLTNSMNLRISDELPVGELDNIYTINKTIVLDPILLNKEIELENIYYDFDKWDIREDAKPSLDALAKILSDNPSIRIQLSSHTDCRGADDFNAELSQKRAQSAVDYIITTGIPASRLNAKGYGESRLSINCLCASCTEEEHQQNRRTTFTIIE